MFSRRACSVHVSVCSRPASPGAGTLPRAPAPLCSALLCSHQLLLALPAQLRILRAGWEAEDPPLLQTDLGWLLEDLEIMGKWPPKREYLLLQPARPWGKGAGNAGCRNELWGGNKPQEMTRGLLKKLNISFPWGS